MRYAWPGGDKRLVLQVKRKNVRPKPMGGLLEQGVQ